MTLRGPGGAPARSLLLVSAFFLLFATIQVVWLARDRRPIVEEKHLFATLRLAHTLLGDDVGRGFPDLGFRSPYPPFVVYLSAPVLALAGTTADLAVLTLLPFMALLLWSMWRAARFFYSPAAAAVAAILILACQHFVVAEERFPPYAFLKEYLLDLPLSAMTALTLALLLLLLRERPTLPRQVALGLTMGLGTLTKVTYPLFLVIILAALLCERFSDWRRWREILLRPAIIATLTALPWYALHIRDLWLALATREFSGDWAAECGKPPIFSLDGILYYPRLLEPMLSLPLLLVIAAATALALLRRSPGSRLAVGGMFVTYLTLTLFFGKGERMIAPCLVFAALAVAALVDQAPPGIRRSALALAIIVASGFRIACLQGIVPGYRHPSGLTAADFAPSGDDWGVGRIMADARARHDPTTLLRVSVVPHLKHLGHNALMQYALEHGFRMSEDSAWKVRDRDWERELELSEFILTKEGDNGLNRFTPHRNNIEAWIAARLGGTVTLAGRYPLPDGSSAALYSHQRAFVTRGRIPAPGTSRDLAVFGEGLALTDVRVARDGDTIRVRCEWLARKPPRREYRIFIHVRRGWINLAAETYAPGDGLLPVIDWAPGTALAEEYSLPVPAECRETSCAVWLGWHFAGSNLSVTTTSLPRFWNSVLAGPVPP